MFKHRSIRSIILLALFTLLFSGSVLADDGRINRAPYHFGGDTLFCTEETGCTLLDKTGHELANWPQNDIATAFAASDVSGQNVQVNGEGQGTYGPMQLWSVSPDEKTGNNMLCMIGFDEWGKQNDMCFPVTKDYDYEQAGVAVSAAATPSPEATNVPTPEVPTPTPSPSPTPSPTPSPNPCPNSHSPSGVLC